MPLIHSFTRSIVNPCLYVKGKSCETSSLCLHFELIQTQPKYTYTSEITYVLSPIGNTTII